MTIDMCLKSADSQDHQSLAYVFGTILAILAKLDVSVVGSQKALLALDPEAIERRTREQIALTNELASSLDAANLPANAKAGFSNQAFPGAACGLQKELRNRAMRVRDAARLQLALLARAQRKLRVIANVLAGREAIYGNPLSPLHTVFSARSTRMGESGPCRA
jgi:hypothetical protein